MSSRILSERARPSILSRSRTEWSRSHFDGAEEEESAVPNGKRVGRDEEEAEEEDEGKSPGGGVHSPVWDEFSS